MINLLVFRERLKAIYGKYDIFINVVVRFILALTVFQMLNQNIGYMEKLKNPIIPVGLALTSMVLPYGGVVFLAALFILAHIFTVSFELTLITVVLFILIGLLYYGFHPRDSYLLLLTPVLFVLKIPYLVPILVGLGGSLFSAIPVCCGIGIYYLIAYVKQNAGLLTNDASIDITQKYVQIFRVLVSNQTMIVMMIAFALCILAVYLIRNLSLDYSWIIAIITGTIVLLITLFIGDFMYNISVPVFSLVWGIILSALIAGIYHFFVFAVDYSRTEYTQFEDDDYYYYVKAVPKIVVSAPDIKVQKINHQKNRSERAKNDRIKNSGRREQE